MNANYEPRLRVKHPRVTSRELVSAYDRPDASALGWRPALELPVQCRIQDNQFEPKFTLYKEMIEDMFAPGVDYELESWRERISSGISDVMDLRMFELVYESHGRAPLRHPWKGPSKTHLERVFYRNPLTNQKVIHTIVQEPWMKNAKKDIRHTHVWIFRQDPDSPPNGSRARPYELVNILGLPFYLYRPGEWDKPAGSDPFRMHLMVGVGRYLPPVEFWRTMSLMIYEGVIDPKMIQEFRRAVR